MELELQLYSVLMPVLISSCFEEILQVRGNLVSIFSLQEDFVLGLKV